MNWIIEQRVDLKSAPDKCIPVYALMFPGDKLAHEWKLYVYEGGEEVDLSGGSVAVYFRRYDRLTVLVTGTISGNVITIRLPQECYAIPGAMEAGVRYTKNGATATLAYRWFDVRQRYETDSIIDPGEVIPSIDDLLNMVENMEYCVRYDEAQGLSSAQQATARANIGMSAADDGEGNITLS